MAYPAIVYERSSGDTVFADNVPYRREKRYQVTVIDRDPDSVIPDAVADLPSSTEVRFFAAGQLNHSVYNLFF